MRNALLICGIASALFYVGGDVLGSVLYPGFSFTDQAVSELFAIGAPTSHLVVSLFSISSGLLGAFAVGVWRSSGGSRVLRLMAFAFAGSALVGVVLWNVFPMHMRGAETGFTDKMHLLLATNPFVLLSLACGAAAFRNWFRFFTAGTILVVLVLAVVAFRFAPNVQASQPTPYLGLLERLGQYIYELWQVVLAVVLVRTPNADPH